MQATARSSSVFISKFCARRRLIRSVVQRMILAEAFHDGGNVSLLPLDMRADRILADLASDDPSHAIFRVGVGEVLMLHGVAGRLAGVSCRLRDYFLDQLLDVVPCHFDFWCLPVFHSSRPMIRWSWMRWRYSPHLIQISSLGDPKPLIAVIDQSWRHRKRCTTRRVIQPL